MGSNFCLFETDRSLQLKPFPNSLMLSLFILPSSQFQKSPPSNLERDVSTSGGDAGGFSSRRHCLLRLSDKHLNQLSCCASREPALPLSHQDKHFRRFPAPTSRTSQDRSKACLLLSVLGTPSYWEQADPKHRVAVSASHLSKLNYCCNHLQEKLLRFKQQP